MAAGSRTAWDLQQTFLHAGRRSLVSVSVTRTSGDRFVKEHFRCEGVCAEENFKMLPHGEHLPWGRGEPRLQLRADHCGPLLVREEAGRSIPRGYEAQRNGGVRGDGWQHPYPFELLSRGVGRRRRHAEWTAGALAFSAMRILKESSSELLEQGVPTPNYSYADYAK